MRAIRYCWTCARRKGKISTLCSHQMWMECWRGQGSKRTGCTRGKVPINIFNVSGVSSGVCDVCTFLEIAWRDIGLEGRVVHFSILSDPFWFRKQKKIGPLCSNDTWDSSEALQDLTDHIDPHTLVIKDEKYIPRCRKCGSVAYHNANANRYWVNDRYEEQRERFLAWLESVQDKKLVAIEVGCGERLPFIRYPLERIIYNHSRKGKATASLVRINPTEPNVSEALKGVGLPLGFARGMVLLKQEMTK